MIYSYCIYKFYCSFSNLFHVRYQTAWLAYFCFFSAVMLLQVITISPILKFILLLISCIIVNTVHVMESRQKILATASVFGVSLITEVVLVIISSVGELHLFAIPSFNAMTGRILWVSFVWILLLLCKLYVEYHETKYINYIDLPAHFCLPISIIFLSCISLIFDINGHKRAFSFGSIPLLNDIKRPDLLFYFICITLLLLDALLIYICEHTKKLKQLEIEQEVLSDQKAFYENQVSVLAASEQNILSIRHDMNNHLAALHSMANNDNTELKKYLQEILDLETVIKASSTGNIIIDGIINYKAKIISDHHIEFDYHAAIPHELPFSQQDITVILGNLIDNAIDATKKVPPEKHPYISVDLSYRRNCFIIVIKNPYAGEISLTSDSLSTTKDDSHLHGFGLKNVKKAVEKNDGILDIKYTDNVFSVCVILNE